MKSWLVLLTISLLTATPCFAESRSALAKSADQLYNQEKYQQALEKLTELYQTSPNDPRIQYNMGNAYYRLKKFPQAEKTFRAASLAATRPALKKKSLFNLGNAYYRQGKLDDSIAAYASLLEIDPDNMAAKQNLEYVQREIKKRKKREKERRESKGRQDKKKKKKKKEKKKDAPKDRQQGQKEGEGEKEKKPAQQGQKEGEQGQPHQPRKEGGQAKSGQKQGAGQQDQRPGHDARYKGGDPSAIDKEEAARWLNSLKEDPSTILRKRAQAQAKGVAATENDW